MELPFIKKAIAIGECHGILNLMDFKLEIIHGFLRRNMSLTIFLERGFDQQGQINSWMNSGYPDQEFKKRFLNPTTSLFLNDQYLFLDGLAQLYHAHSDQLNIHCIDISFDNPSEVQSQRVLSCTDEDQFDQLREEFIIDRMREYQSLLHHTDKIIWFCGNMHASKTANYFPLDDKSSLHIRTSSMWLDSEFDLESVFTLPFSGDSTYQKNGRLAQSHFAPQSSIFETLTHKPFDGLRSTSSLEIPSPEFIESYDWVFGIKKALHSEII